MHPCVQRLEESNRGAVSAAAEAERANDDITAKPTTHAGTLERVSPAVIAQYTSCRDATRLASKPCPSDWSTQLIPRGTSEGGTSQVICPTETVLPYSTSSPRPVGRSEPDSALAGLPDSRTKVEATDSTVQVAPSLNTSHETFPLGAWNERAGPSEEVGPEVVDVDPPSATANVEGGVW
jgi:hypothetical protein